MTALQKAYNDWVETFPGKHPGSRTHNHSKKGEFRIAQNFDGACGCYAHAKTIGKERVYVPLPDTEVCTRERRWREYISVRDGVDYHVK